MSDPPPLLLIGEIRRNTTQLTCTGMLLLLLLRHMCMFLCSLLPSRCLYRPTLVSWTP
jgi:hypothetical protein